MAALFFCLSAKASAALAVLLCGRIASPLASRRLAGSPWPCCYAAGSPPIRCARLSDAPAYPMRPPWPDRRLSAARHGRL